MAFIKAQKIVRDKNNVIVSGSAAVVDSVYVGTGQKSHSKHEVREKLGKVLYLTEDKKQGVFLSPTRGLVQYDADSDTFEAVEKSDPRIQGRGAYRVVRICFRPLKFIPYSGIPTCCFRFWKRAVC